MFWSVLSSEVSAMVKDMRYQLSNKHYHKNTPHRDVSDISDGFSQTNGVGLYIGIVLGRYTENRPISDILKYQY